MARKRYSCVVSRSDHGNSDKIFRRKNRRRYFKTFLRLELSLVNRLYSGTVRKTNSKNSKLLEQNHA